MNPKVPYIKFKNGEVLRPGDIKKTQNGELTIQKFVYGYDIASRSSIINHLIIKNNLKNYLEIGVRKGENFKKINANYKVAVDPNPIFETKNLVKTTSDNFFSQNNKIFDIIFIDGLHLEEQVDKDIQNSLKFISKNGYILLHDCNPPTKFHQRETYEVDGKFPPWNGTVWRSFAKLRMIDSTLSLFCVDCDWGIGIIIKKNSNLYKLQNNLTYDYLEKNRIDLLNLISVKKFIDYF